MGNRDIEITGVELSGRTAPRQVYQWVAMTIRLR